MKYNITTENLERLAAEINEAAGAPQTRSLHGNYHLSQDNSGYAMERTDIIQGITTNTFITYGRTPDALHTAMHAFLKGYKTAKGL